MTIVSWLGLLVMCIFGWLSYIQRRDIQKRESEELKQIFYISNKPNYLIQPDHITLPAIPRKIVTKKKPTRLDNYDDPERSISIR